MPRLRTLLVVGLIALPLSVPVSPALAVAPAAQPIPDRLAGQDWTALPTREKSVALTIDAGANAAAMPKILRVLKRTGVPATFFLTGAWVRSYPDLTRRLVARGYPLGNHTDTHPRVSTLSDAALARQLRATEQAVRAATGSTTRPFFRFPYGDRRLPLDVQRVNRLGYVCVGWTVDTAGWLGTSGGQSVETIRRRVLTSLRPGQIILMHAGSNPKDGSILDGDALPFIIRDLTSRGYSFTTLDAFNVPR
jgi:peptidoglycan-N-acetylglucosamine deacetylase